MIPLHAPQDGLVMRRVENALWPTQVMDSEVNQPVKTTANHMAQLMMNTDAMQLVIPAKNVKMAILDAHKIELPHVPTAKMAQIQPNFSDATRLTQINQCVKNARKVERTPLVACQEVKPVAAAHQSQNFSNVMRRH